MREDTLHCMRNDTGLFIRAKVDGIPLSVWSCAKTTELRPRHNTFNVVVHSCVIHSLVNELSEYFIVVVL